MKFKVNKDINITRPRSTNSYCSFCGLDIGISDCAVSIGRYPAKNCIGGHHTNCWLHIGCVDQFTEKVKQIYDKNINKIVAEKLTG